MADKRYRVELTASFLERLDAIEAFPVEADAGFAFDTLLAELRATVIPNPTAGFRLTSRSCGPEPDGRNTVTRGASATMSHMAFGRVVTLAPNFWIARSAADNSTYRHHQTLRLA